MMRDEIVAATVRALSEAHAELGGRAAPEPVWTQGVKTKLCEAASTLNFAIAASGCPGAEWGEWLYDLCWLDYARKTPAGKLEYLRAVPLVMESEWGNAGDIEDDFEKLLVARAIVKLLVFDGRAAPVARMGDRLRYLLCKFTAVDADDFFLLAAYTEVGFRYASLTGNGELTII